MESKKTIHAKNSNENPQEKNSHHQPSPTLQDGESNLAQMDDLPRVDAGYRSTREARRFVENGLSFGEDSEIFSCCGTSRCTTQASHWGLFIVVKSLDVPEDQLLIPAIFTFGVSPPPTAYLFESVS